MFLYFLFGSPLSVFPDFSLFFLFSLSLSLFSVTEKTEREEKEEREVREHREKRNKNKIRKHRKLIKRTEKRRDTTKMIKQNPLLHKHGHQTLIKYDLAVSLGRWAPRFTQYRRDLM